jgi:flagellar biosynthesis protein FliR
VEAVDQLAAQWMPAFILVLARISGLFIFAPIFSSRLVPMRAKLLVALGISFAAAPIAATQALPTDLIELAALVVKELIIGSAIGLSVACVFSAVQFAGGLIDLTVGFSFANVMDPLQNTQISIVGQLYSLLASAVFLTIGGHTLLVGALVRSFDVVPVNGWPNFADLTAGVIHASAGLLAVGLALAAPIVVTLLVTDVAVGFLARIAPQMNIFGIELPAKVLATFALLIVTAPFLVEGIAGRFDTGLDFTLRLISEMGATN